MSNYRSVIYKSIPCKLYESYMGPGDGPLVMVSSSADLEKAYSLGFECIGHPNEVVKYLGMEEYRELVD